MTDQPTPAHYSDGGLLLPCECGLAGEHRHAADQPTPRAPEPDDYGHIVRDVWCDRPVGSHSSRCVLAAPEPTAPDDLQDKIAETLRTFERPIDSALDEEFAAAAVMDVLRREGLVT